MQSPLSRSTLNKHSLLASGVRNPRTARSDSHAGPRRFIPEGYPDKWLLLSACSTRLTQRLPVQDGTVPVASS